MNTICKVIAATSLFAVASASFAVEYSVNTMDTRVLPVFVQVNAEGEVTRILPAEPLAPKFNRMLEATIRGWIKKPAMDKGHAVNSSMIMRVALNVQQRNDGNYDLAYHYVSGTAVPMASASSYWRWINNHLALVTGSDEPRYERRDFERYASDRYPVDYDRSSQVAMPAQNNAGGRASGRSGSRGH